jgi:hypothetical protein
VVNVNSDYRREAEALVKRCEAVGWQVVKTGKNYYKVDTRHGIFTIPSTPSSANSVRNTTNLANKHGLENLERKLAERDERDRLQRIADDRSANDARLERAAAVNGAAEVATTVIEPAPSTVDDGPNLGDVDGVRIVAIAPACVQTPVMLRPAPLDGGEELLLADDRVVYRCVRIGSYRVVDNGVVDQTKPCHQIFPTAHGLMVHIGRHTLQRRRREEAAATVLNKIADAYRKPDADAEAPIPTAESTSVEPSNFDATRELLLARIEELSGTVFDIGGKLIDVRNTLIGVVDVIRDLEPEVREVRVEVEVEGKPDPELVAKAAKFDALSETMKGLFQ